MWECLASFYSWYKLSMFIIFGVCIIYKYNILGQMIIQGCCQNCFSRSKGQINRKWPWIEVLYICIKDRIWCHMYQMLYKTEPHRSLFFLHLVPLHGRNIVDTALNSIQSINQSIIPRNLSTWHPQNHVNKKSKAWRATKTSSLVVVAHNAFNQICNSCFICLAIFYYYHLLKQSSNDHPCTDGHLITYNIRIRKI